MLRAQPVDCDPFLRALAHVLHSEAEIGDGAVFRACRRLQRQFFKTPAVTTQPAPRLVRVYAGEVDPRLGAAAVLTSASLQAVM